MLKIYNTLTRTQEEFRPISPDRILFYHCGPTVYWVQHIGNLRAMTMADLVRRSLIYLGYKVDFVRNYTDVGHLVSDEDEGEDKMEKGAKREGLSPQEIADKYIAVFEHDTKALNLLPPDVSPRATGYIQQMIEMVQTLVEKGYAYSTNQAIYYDVSKFPDYTKLSGRKLEDNLEGAGHGDVTDPDKKHPYDFAVWFFKTGVHKNALQYWDSPFESPEVENGQGFPGWHIECSAMARAELGITLDLHMGGIEHISVHHPNEIAQSEAANGVKFVNYWLHNEHLTVDGGKMSKSEGTTIVLEDIQKKGFYPLVLRYFFLQAHYRSQQNFTWEALEASKTAMQRLWARVIELDTNSAGESGEVDTQFKAQFGAALEEDFSVPQALAVAWELLKSDIADADKLATILDFDRVLGLNLEFAKAEQHPIPAAAQELLDQRAAARAAQNWQESDSLRDQLLEEFELIVEDSDSGQKVRPAGQS